MNNKLFRTKQFDDWLRKLSDPIGKARILARLRAAELGHFGDHGPVGDANPRHQAREGLSTPDGGRAVSKADRFDAADYLDSDEVIAEYLNVALASENPDLFLQAIADVAKARGMSRLSEVTGLGRESLYKAFAPGAKPRYDTVLKVLRALGVELHVTAMT